MSNVEIYTTNYCPYCTRAKDLLTRKGQSYSEIDVTGDDSARAELIEKANGMRTVPQIFINGEHIGGYDDMTKLEKDGTLDQKLAS